MVLMKKRSLEKGINEIKVFMKKNFVYTQLDLYLSWKKNQIDLKLLKHLCMNVIRVVCSNTIVFPLDLLKYNECHLLRNCHVKDNLLQPLMTRRL